MECWSGDVEDGTQDNPGHKKSRMTSLKTRLLWRSKRADEESNRKLSQSARDITANKDVGSQEDLGSEGIMGSRALSHDSIFLADEDSVDEDPVRVLSQENVHGKIKALQMKLQQQKLHLGPPPLVVPIRRHEDSGSRSEDLRHHHSPVRVSETAIDSQASPIKSISPPCYRPLSPVYRPASFKTVPLSKAQFNAVSASETSADLRFPPPTSRCLDTAAARHRISVKPKNQRPSLKKRQPAQPESQTFSVDESFAEKMQILTDNAGNKKAADRVKPVELEGKVPDMSRTSLTQKNHAVSGRTFSSSPVRVKSHREGRPHSSFISSEMIKDLEKLYKDDKRKIQRKPEVADTKEVLSEQMGFSHSSRQGELEERGVQRNFSVSGSSRFSGVRGAERPRSGSFAGVFGPRQKAEETRVMMRDNDDLSTRGRLGKAEPDEAVHKVQEVPLEKRSGLKTMEPASRKLSMDVVVSQVEVEERSQEKMERASEEKNEQQEKDGRNVYGFKLRSTNHSVRLWSNYSARQTAEAPEEEKKQDKEDSETNETNRRPNYDDIKTADPPLYGIAFPVELPPASPAAPLMPTGVQTSVAESPKPAAPEASWMSLTMVKAKSLFTSRFPREVPSNQSSSQTPSETQYIRVQPQKNSPLDISPSKTSKDSPSTTSRSLPEEACWSFAGHSHPRPSEGSFSPSPPKSLLSGHQQTTWTAGGPVVQFQPSTTLVTKVSSFTPDSSTSPELPSSLHDKESSWSPGRQVCRAGSVSERAAFLERRSSVLTKAVEVKKETSASDESPVHFKSIQIKEWNPEERLHAESSPSKVPQRPREEKWLRKNVASASPPSAVDGGQPSWMELAKRKSMAWSNNSMES